MKLLNHSRQITADRRAEQGLAVIVVIAILAILFVYIADNARTLNQLKREVKLVERQQTNRLAHVVISTNSMPVHPNEPAPSGK